MQAILIYGLKACIYSGVFFLYYHIALRNKRFHYYNRFYLLMAVAASLLLPFLNIAFWRLNSSDKQVINLANFVQADGSEVIIKQADSYFSAENIIAVFYGCIALYLLLLLIFSIIKIFTFKRRFPVEQLDDIHFISTDLEQAPFSFFNNLFWKNTIEIGSDIGKQIFRHELTHIEQKHSCDKIFMRIVTALFFVNPVYWLLQKELSLIHEFIADDKAIENKSAEAFARMLLQSQYGKTIFSPAQSFNYSPIKRRLFMLTTSKKPRFSYTRRLMILPLIAITVLLFAFKLKKEEFAVKETHKTTSLQQQNFYKDTTPVSERTADAKPLKTPVSKAKSDDKTVIIKTDEKDSMLIVVDGKPVNSTELHLLNPDNIESISVLKDENVISKYGEKGKNGVVIITSKNKGNTKQPTAFFVPPVIEKDKADTSDNAEKVFQSTQTPPSFPGGKDEWLKYLQRNLNSNLLTDKKAPTGTYTAVVSFTVDAEGNLSDFKAEKDPGYGTGAEAVRVIQRGPKWIPAKQNGQAVTAATKQAITFVVSDEPK